MDQCAYKIVHNREAEDKEFSWKYFLRQLFVCSAIWVNYLIQGMNVGSPTVFIPQIRREANSTAAVSESMATWLTSVFGFASLPWMIILPIASSYVGRKFTYLFICISLFVANILLNISKTVTDILIAEIILGVEGACVFSISAIVLAEYTSPQYRGIFFSCKSSNSFWGIWLSNAIGTFFHWKNIVLITTILSIYPIIVVLLWPESPYYLANKSKFKQCVKSFRWLKGYSESSNKELTRLLAPKNNLVTEKKPFLKVIVTKRYYQPLLLSMGCLGFYQCTGKLIVVFYSIDIIKKMSSSDRSAYIGMLILDGVTVLAMYIGTVLTKYIRRKVFLLSTAAVGIISLFLLSIHVYLVSITILSQNLYVSLGLLSLYTLAIGCGPIILIFTIVGEIMPLQYYDYSFSFCGVMYCILMGVVTKFTPNVAKTFGLHVVFFSFALTSSILIYLLYLYLPETKDKTLFEISDSLSGDNKEAQTLQE